MKAKAKTPAAGGGQAAKTDAAIADIYNQLAGDLASGTGTQGMNFDRARQLIGASYDGLSQSIKEGASATVGGLTGRFAKLGIGSATDAATQGLRNELNQALMSAARRKSNDLAGMAQQQGGYEMASRMGVDNAYREKAQVRSESQTRIAEAIANMQAAIASARGQAELARIQGQTQLEQMKLQFEQSQQKASQGDPLEALKAEQLGWQIRLLEQKYNNGGSGGSTKEPWSSKGQGGLNKFLTEPSDYWDQHAGPKFTDSINKIVQYGLAQANNPANGSMGTGQDDPYLWAVQEASKNYDWLNQQALLQALQIYFGKA